jgi:hypothetical protein
MQSENTAGAEQIEEQEPGIEHLGEMLEMDEPQGSDDAGASGEDSGSDDPKPTKFNDLAGKLGVELDDLYKLEISQAEDGTPVTIENLKDHYAKQGDLSLREIEFEERRTQQEAELMQAQEELRELMAALPEKAIKPEVLQKVRSKHDAQMNLERRRTLEVIPEWNDADKRLADLEGMSEHLKQYGYPVNHLERVADHRQIKYIRDNWQREQRIRIALERVRAGKPNPAKPSKPTGKAPQKRPLSGVKRGNARNKLEAVFSELD